MTLKIKVPYVSIPYDDRLTAKEFGLLFGESEDKVFDGFWAVIII